MPLRPQIIAFGDSITQHGFGEGGWVARVAEAYGRRADVLNRGYSGYNSRWAVALLPHVFPTGAPPPLLVTVFFGANDAALQGKGSGRQHVPLEEYRQNLQAIVSKLRDRGAKHIVIITPPPIVERKRIDKAYNNKAQGNNVLERMLAVTASYAQAAREVAAELNTPCVNAFDGFMQQHGWEDMLHDGLHFAASGNAKLFELLMVELNKIETLRPEQLAWDAPWHDALDGDTYGQTIEEYMKNKPADDTCPNQTA